MGLYSIMCYYYCTSSSSTSWFLIIGETVDNHTLLFHILDNTTNGDQIVLKELDRCVVTDAPDLQQRLSYNHDTNKIDRLDKLRIDFSRLKAAPAKHVSSFGSGVGCLIKDVMRTAPDKRKELLLHPVFVTYVDECWKKITRYESTYENSLNPAGNL